MAKTAKAALAGKQASLQAPREVILQDATKTVVASYDLVAKSIDLAIRKGAFNLDQVDETITALKALRDGLQTLTKLAGPATPEAPQAPQEDNKPAE